MDLKSKRYSFGKRRKEFDKFQFEFDIASGTFEEDFAIQLQKTIGNYENFCIEQIELVDADGGGADITLTVQKVIHDEAGLSVYVPFITETGASISINVLDYPIFGREFGEKLNVKVEGTTGRIIMVLTVSYF